MSSDDQQPTQGRGALRVAGVLGVALVAAGGTTAWGRPASPSASPAAAAAPAPGGPRLFADSEMMVRPRLSVEVVGRGPDLVLIPGLASSRETWRRTAERLRGRWRLHLVQVAGFAGEPARLNASGPVFDPVLADLDGYLASLKRPPVVVGHSLGGTLALAEAERHPGRISRLMLVDTLPFYGVLMGGPAATADSVRPMAERFRAGVGTMPEPMMRAMMAQMVTAPADVDRVVGWSRASAPAVVGAAMADDMTTDLRPGLASVAIPVTVIHETVLEPMVRSGYAPLPSKTLVPVADAKHFIMYDQPARFDAALDAFLGSGANGGG